MAVRNPLPNPVDSALGALGKINTFPKKQKAVIQDIIDTVNAITDGGSSFDTISELTAGAGVTIDSVLLKDGAIDLNGKADSIILDADGDTTISAPTDDQIDIEISGADDFRFTANTFTALSGSQILTADGVVGTPGLGIGAADTGFYVVSGTQTGFTQDGSLVALFDTDGIKSDSVRARVELFLPEAASTATSVSYGDGRNFTTVITLAAGTVSIAGAANEAVGLKLGAFPAGAHLHEVTYMSIGATAADPGNAAVTPDIGIGSVVGTGAVAVLGGTSTFEDYITGQTGDTVGTPVVKTSVATAGALTGISINEAGDVKDVFLNIAGAWAATDTVTLAGTVTLKWTILS